MARPKYSLRQPPPEDPFALPLYANIGTIDVVRQVLGTQPLWVRVYNGHVQSGTCKAAPRQSWWGRDVLRLAIRTLQSEYVGDEDGDYLHCLQVYYLRPIDLLTQIEGKYVPAEAVPWGSVLAASSRLTLNVPTMSLNKVVRLIRSDARSQRQLEHRPRLRRKVE
jgi:hypothetical protein